MLYIHVFGDSYRFEIDPFQPDLFTNSSFGMFDFFFKKKKFLQNKVRDMVSMRQLAPSNTKNSMPTRIP